MLFRVFWTDAPRWLYVPLYIAMGWAAVFFLPAFLDGATRLGVGIGIATFTMIVVGGALYTFGGVVYGFKRPNPWPRWFGFHEVFHTFTILAFVVPLRRRLAGDVLPALTSTRPHADAYGTAPATHAVPFQLAVELSASTTRWPVVHGDAGLATIPVSDARLAGVAVPAGVNVPGLPAVAPVAGDGGMVRFIVYVVGAVTFCTSLSLRAGAGAGTVAVTVQLPRGRL